MSPQAQTGGNEPGLASLTSGILHDVQELFTQQLQLFRHEVESKIRQSVEASACLVLGASLATVGFILLGFTLVYLLVEMAGWSHWASFATVGGVLFVIGGVVAYLGVLQLKAVNPLPEQTGEALKETLEWTTNQK